MTELFTPIGEKSHREIVVEAFKDVSYDDVVSYEHLSEILGFDVKTSNRSAIYAAQRTLEKDYHKTLDAVVGVGYRVIRPEEHVDLANRHHKRARRQVTRAINKTASANRSVLTATDQARLDRVEINLKRQQKELTRLDAEVKRVSERVDAQQKTNEETETRYAKIVRALKTAGIEVED